MIDLREELENIRNDLEESSGNFRNMNAHESEIIGMLMIAANADIPGLLSRFYSEEHVRFDEVVRYQNIFLESIKKSQECGDVRKEIHLISLGVDEIYNKLLEMI